MASSSSNRPPAPSGQALSLISALSNPANHDLHVQAIRARDEALSSSIESYNSLCLQLAYTLVGSDEPQDMLSRIASNELETWTQTDRHSILRLQQDPSLWVSFGQTAGFILKNALLHPPISTTDSRVIYIQPPTSDHLKETLLFALACKHGELRAVASSIIATSAVSADSVQPALSIHAWPTLVPVLLATLQQQIQQGDQQLQLSPHATDGSLSTIRKILEDGTDEVDPEQLDKMLPLLIHCLASSDDRNVIASLNAIIACVGSGMMPDALVLQLQTYLAALSTLASAQPPKPPSIRKLVCRSIVTLLSLRTEYVRPHMPALCQFMLQQMSSPVSNGELSTDTSVMLEACEFWWTFSNLEEDACTPDMMETVQSFLPQLVPILLTCMVYPADKQKELLARNEMEASSAQQGASSNMRPLFHKSKSKHGGNGGRVSGAASGDNDLAYDSGSDDDNGNDDEDDDDFDEDDDGNEWTLRKCSAASLDCLATLFGAEPILPYLLPALERGLGSNDPWIQEASILALGAVADGCMLELGASMAQLHPYLMSILASSEVSCVLPQLIVITAWTVGRYSAWVVEQVQTGTQGNLLGQMTEHFMNRLHNNNRRVQVACCSAFVSVAEVAGDLMVPYLGPVYQNLVTALNCYQGRSLLVVFDCFGILADCCGPCTGENDLPAIYVPPLLRLWSMLAKNDPTDRTLLPLMESLASVALASGKNYQLYAMETFENAMAVIESVTLILTASGETIQNEEDVDPIVCATDLLDALVEGLGDSFAALVSSSQRYGQQFLSMFVNILCKHEIPSVRMSAFAMVGDIARNAPVVIEPALSQILQETITGMDPMHATVCTNAVWAAGEICVRCEGSDELLRPFAESLMQGLIALLMGNGIGARGQSCDVPGLAENAAACAGRLAKVNPQFVAPELHRFLLGWCDGMAKIIDPTERRDAFQGFVKTVYVNPQAIQEAGDLSSAFASVLFCILTWHMPPEGNNQSVALLNDDYNFRPFPAQEAELGAALVKLVHDMKNSAGEDTWYAVEKKLPVNVRRLLKEYYYV